MKINSSSTSQIVEDFCAGTTRIEPGDSICFPPLHSWNATVTSPVKRTMTTCKQESRTPDFYILGNGMIMRDGKTNRIVRERKTDMGYGDVVLVEARSVNSYYYPENCHRE